jgi:light-regulated signal transduction histidine kinase (bacteriophytochrome)
MYLSVSEVEFNGRRMFTGFVQDLSERKQHEEEAARWREELERRVEERTRELEAANQELESFTYTISHDLRTPLRGIRNYVDFLKEDLADKLDGESLGDLQGLGHAADELEMMVQELLDYSRIGRTENEPERIEVGGLIENIRRSLKTELREAVKVEGELPDLWAPRGLLRQVFQNLIENGLRYNRSEAPWVRISARRHGGDAGAGERWVFEIRDNGIGIDPKYHAKVFGMFQRLHSQEDYPGTGIGLAAVRKAVHFLGGSIELESEPDRGSVFRIVLPERGVREGSTG